MKGVLNGAASVLMLMLLVIALVVLGGCASAPAVAPAPVVHVIKVPVPVPATCPQPKVPPRPVLPSEQLPAQPTRDQVLQACEGDASLLRGYAEQLELLLGVKRGN